MRGGYSPESKHDLVMAKVSIVINGQDGLRLNLIPRQEPVVEAVFLCADNLRDEHTIVMMAVRAQRRDLGAGAVHSSGGGPAFRHCFVAPAIGKRLLSKKHQLTPAPASSPSTCRLLPVSQDCQSRTQAP